MHLYKKVIIGIILGIIAGIFAPEYSEFFAPIGAIFLRIIKSLVPFLVIGYLIIGINSIEKSVSLGTIGLQTVLIYLMLTIFAVCCGIFIGYIFKPGLNVELPHTTQVLDLPRFNFYQFIINLVPSNIIMLLMNYEKNPIQLVFVGIFTGMIMRKHGGVNAVNTVVTLASKMIFHIIQFSHYAAFALIYNLTAQQGIKIMSVLFKLISTILLAMFILYVLYGILIYVFGHISPFPFYKKSLKYQVIALSTSSSKVTLPTTIKVCRHDMGISAYHSTFTLTLGAAINMCASAITLSISTLFFADALELQLSLYHYILIILLSTVGSIGTAGIPGDILIALPIILAAVNMPVELVGILAGVDRILDMFRTVINITGDAAVTLIIDSRNNTLNKEKYYSQ